MPIPIVVLLTAVAVAVTVLAETRGRTRLALVAKPLASCGFLAVAWLAGALEHDFGRAVFAGLVLSWWGDVFLISRARPWFLAGLVSFLLGHVAYVVAFVVAGPQPRATVLAAVVAVLLAGVVGRWLVPRTPAGMRVPVLAYTAVISVMLATAFGAAATTGRAELAAGALAFYVSDLAVARDRFVAPGPLNRAWGLPLYYAGQLLLAWGARS